MSGHDMELDRLRAGVSCAALLERLQPGWLLDKEASTPRRLKYRCGAGEILIINHGGRGWWDPLSDAKGEVFSLTQHLDPHLNFGQVRKLLRGMVGPRPSRPEMERKPGKPNTPAVPAAQLWADRHALRLAGMADGRRHPAQAGGPPRRRFRGGPRGRLTARRGARHARHSAHAAAARPAAAA